MRPQLDLISQATHGISAILAVESMVPGSHGYENDDVGWHVEAEPGVDSRTLLVDGQAVLRTIRTGAESMTFSVLADLPPDIALVLQAMGQESHQLTLTEEEFDHRTSCLDGIWCTWPRFNRARPGEATALTSEVLALADASIDGTEVRLAGQLDSRLYAKVNALLIELGGRWHTGRQAHVFDHSPKDKLAGIAETGTVLTRKCYEFFWTPPEHSSRLIQLLDLKPCMTILEPHAGQGALAMAAAEVLGKDAITCYELMPENVSHLQRLGFSIEGPADFLEVRPVKLYSRIAANPPFSGGRDVVHMRHAFQFLEPDGLFAGITSTRWVKAKDAPSRAFAQFVEEHAVHVEERPAGEFSAAGTDVPTMLALLKRPNDTADASAKVTTALRFEPADQLALFG